jgi:hypothetical protein
MDRVGFEPTTSAHSILVPSAVNGKKLVQIPPSPNLTILGFQVRRLTLVVASHQER